MSIRDQARALIKESRERNTNRSVGKLLVDDTATEQKKSSEFKPRRPSDIPLIGEVEKVIAVPKDQESTERISARVSASSREWITKYVPLLISGKKKSAKDGVGTGVQLMIQELIWHRSELREHLHEIRDYLRQVQNSEKEYYSEIGRPEEGEAKMKFQKCMKNLELVLNMKRLKYEKLMGLYQKGLVDQAFVDEIHYYLNIETYEKWSSRGY